MNSELEKLIEKYRITVNGLADLESGYDQVIKERGFVTLNGLLVSGESAAAHSPSGEENAVNTETHSPSGEENAPVVENTPVADPAPVEPTPVVPAPSDETTTVVEPAPSETVPPTPTVPVENPGVTPVTDGPVSGDTNLGTEVASGESAEAHSPSGEERSEENTDAEEESSDEPAAGGKPKKKKATGRTAPSEEK